MPRGRKKATSKLTVTWKKSAIGYEKSQQATITALGLKRLNQSIEIDDTPVMRGMLEKVKHLIEVK